jgi:predicted Zn-dependent peptidase
MPSERRVMMLLLNRLTTLKDDLLNEEIHGAIIDGITVFVLPKKGFRRKYAEVFINYGSNDNAFIPYDTQAPVHVPPGIAHFLEHKMFEKPWGEAFSAFASIGASANAYTGNNYTSYLFWTLENYEKALELLMEVVFSPYFTDETVEKEKGIISQEIRMYEDQPSSRLFKETISTLYFEHPVRLDIAGTEDSIKEITKDLLYLCHSNFYCGPNTSLFMAGDFEPEDAFATAARIIARFVPEAREAPKRVRPDEPAEVGGNVSIPMPVPTPLLQVGWKDNRLLDGQEMIRRELATTLLLDIIFGKSSPFFARVYEEGLADDLSFSYEAWPDYAFSLVAAESEEPGRLIDMILHEVDRIRREGFSKEDFERKKKAALGRFITLFNSFDAVGQTQVHLFKVGQDVFSYGSMLRDLEVDALWAGLDCFDVARSANVIIKNDNAN